MCALVTGVQTCALPIFPIRIPSAKINRNGIGKRNPCFSICAEIAVGIAFVAAQTFIEVGNAIGTEITRDKACRHRAKYNRTIPDGLCRVTPPLFGASLEREFFCWIPRAPVDDAPNCLPAPTYESSPYH